MSITISTVMETLQGNGETLNIDRFVDRLQVSQTCPTVLRPPSFFLCSTFFYLGLISKRSSFLSSSSLNILRDGSDFTFTYPELIKVTSTLFPCKLLSVG